MASIVEPRNSNMISATSAPGMARRGFIKQSGLLALSALLGLPAGKSQAAQVGTPHRIVVMDWPLTETLLALGVTPIGVAAPEWYRMGIVLPPLPSSVVDVGLLYSPNYEVLEELKPDLIIITPGHAPARPLLERLAPTLTLGRYFASPQPYPVLCAETLRMAQVVGRYDAGKQLLDNTENVMSGVRQRLSRYAGALRQPVIMGELVDDRHLRVYGAGSLPDVMLSKIGVRNAVNHGPASAWKTSLGGYAMVPMQRLFELPPTTLLLTGTTRSSQKTQLAHDELWQIVPAIKSHSVATLPVIKSSGGLYSMQRFALAVEKALIDIADGRGGLG